MSDSREPATAAQGQPVNDSAKKSEDPTSNPSKDPKPQPKLSQSESCIRGGRDDAVVKTGDKNVSNEDDARTRAVACSSSAENGRTFVRQKRTLSDIHCHRVEDFARNRSQSLCAPSPRIDFGPKASIMKSCLGLYTMEDPSTLRLNWEDTPETVLVIKKQYDNGIIPHFKELLHFLVVDKKVTVYVEDSVVEESLVLDPSFSVIKNKVIAFEPSFDLTNRIDLIICMGGDGTLLHVSSIFQHSVPPVLSFHLGSLGFLMPFDFTNYRSDVDRVLNGDVPLVLRSRLKGTVYKKSHPTQAPLDAETSNGSTEVATNGVGSSDDASTDATFLSTGTQDEDEARTNGFDASPSVRFNENRGTEDVVSQASTERRSTSYYSAPESLSFLDQNVSKSSTSLDSRNRPENEYLVLNEIVIHRGSSAFITNVDLYLNGRMITRVQGDGLIISTPTGSTAYALAAGSSMVHPSVQSILISPICPHSLSFRPILVPAGVELKLKLDPEARSTAWVSFDGRNRQEMNHGDVLKVTTSVHPVPSVARTDQLQDWFDSLADCLNWNVRQS